MAESLPFSPLNPYPLDGGRDVRWRLQHQPLRSGCGPPMTSEARWLSRRPASSQGDRADRLGRSRCAVAEHASAEGLMTDINIGRALAKPARTW